MRTLTDRERAENAACNAVAFRNLINNGFAAVVEVCKEDGDWILRPGLRERADEMEIGARALLEAKDIETMPLWWRPIP